MLGVRLGLQFNLNVRSMFRLIRGFLPGMLAKGGGSISTCPRPLVREGIPDRCVYGTTKAAVIGLTKSVAADFIRRGMRCNAICPAAVECPRSRDASPRSGKATGRRSRSPCLVDRQPIGRIGTARGSRRLAVYLASDESAFTTGQIHIIDGGWSM